MAGGRNPLKQVALPFAEGEASHAERWNDLGIALLRIGRRCDAQMSALVRWIFNVTRGGVQGALVKSYAELAERPWGLCCSPATARRTVALTERLGLILVDQQRRWDGSQQSNAYAINWPGVLALKNGRSTGAQIAQGGAQAEHLGAQVAQGGAQFERHTKEFSLIQSSCKKEFRTGPETDPNPIDDSSEADGDRNQAQTLGRALCDDSPILRQAAGRTIAPLPANSLRHGVYAPLNAGHLARPIGLVEWHRRQLSTAVPVMGHTEADLLLTIATALYAQALKDCDVRKSRIAAFCSAISKRQWTKSLPFVPAARKLLDDAIIAYGPAWAGLADETGQNLDPADVEAEKVGAET